MGNKRALVGIFSYLDDLLEAIEVLKKVQVKIHTVFSPIPLNEIHESLGLKPSPVRYFTLLGGIIGLAVGMGLAIYASSQWKFIVGGKPVLAWPPFAVVGFEFTILLGVLFTIVGMLIKSRMPKVVLPDHYDPRFSQDRFGLMIYCGETEGKEVTRRLKEAGAEEVHEFQGGDK
ncbi:MAG: DUF3341 domain-containing protein [Desulfatiglandales bacterium]